MGLVRRVLPDSRYVISGSADNTIRVWDVETGESVCDPLKGHSNWVFSVAFSPDGQRIVSSSYDKTIRVWDVRALEIKDFVAEEQNENVDAEARRAHWNACCLRISMAQGWIKDGDKLLLWIPQRYRTHFQERLHFAIGDEKIIGFKPEVDLAKLYTYIGERWTDIYTQ